LVENAFHIVFCSDDAFAEHTAVAIRSLVDNASDLRRLQIWVLDAGMSSKSRAMMGDLFSELKISIEFPRLNLADVQTLPADRHVSIATYGRIFIQESLDDSIKRCLYLDGDLIVLDDILKLAEITLQNKCIAAVDDFCLERRAALSMPSSIRYFNAGVILFDLERWRNENISTRILNYVAQYPENLVYWDQDAMNAVLCEKRRRLPLRWNQQIHFDEYPCSLAEGCAEAEILEAISDPAIVHFVGPEKPWHFMCLNPSKHLYYTFRERTPWAGYSLPDPERLADFFSDKRIVIFGAGKKGEVTIRLYRKYGCNPEYVIDNDPLKAGGTLEGLPIHLASYLDKEDQDRSAIIIASMYSDEIIKQLKIMGLEEFRHFVVRGYEHLFHTTINWN
jgi:lipopolysaccharide biosynthesis glycosyltransferase